MLVNVTQQSTQLTSRDEKSLATSTNASNMNPGLIQFLVTNKEPPRTDWMS